MNETNPEIALNMRVFIKALERGEPIREDEMVCGGVRMKRREWSPKMAVRFAIATICVLMEGRRGGGC